ncbi:hypothetical protein [Confluentibacter flavum]|uniref:Uncharacterized protein n=1 Tax=Confluentibacter flavum TaxID=1909700 RepID=A0A2N3HLR0_9FLAO|nr:hypothetical protein [Confluentibacter flavum]PKQ45778.1 hypothetical protein CSW08_06860 [Confluentibacter flavum]
MDATIQKLLTKISERVRSIEENYPELQKYLDETRITLPQSNDDSQIDKKDLEDYLNSLDSMVDEYKKAP